MSARVYGLKSRHNHGCPFRDQGIWWPNFEQRLILTLMYIIPWEYVAKVGRETAFEKSYGSNGDWAQLSKQAEGYLGTDLLRDSDIHRRYITIDRWVSSEAYDIFQEKYHELYEELDVRCQSLTNQERLIGKGDMCSPT